MSGSPLALRQTTMSVPQKRMIDLHVSLLQGDRQKYKKGFFLFDVGIVGQKKTSIYVVLLKFLIIQLANYLN